MKKESEGLPPTDSGKTDYSVKIYPYIEDRQQQMFKNRAVRPFAVHDVYIFRTEFRKCGKQYKKMHNFRARKLEFMAIIHNHERLLC